MDITTASSEDDEQLYSNGRRVAPAKSTSTLPKAFSLPAVQQQQSGMGGRHQLHKDDEPHYAIPPHGLETPRDAGPEIQDYPATTISPKRIYLTSVNQSHELRVAWAVLIVQTLLAVALLALGAYHVIEAHRDVEDAPNTLLSEAVAAAPAQAVSLYYEAVTILQLSLIILFTAGLGLAAYFPNGIRQPSKMVFLIFVCLSIHLSLNCIAAISEELAHRINIQMPNASYRIGQLIVLVLLVICLTIASYPACSSLIVYKFEKQSSQFLRVVAIFVNAVALLVFIVHGLVCFVSINRGYYGYVSRVGATVRLSYAICALAASFYGVTIVVGTFRAVCGGSRPVGVWAGVVSAPALLVMYNATPLLSGLLQDVRGDHFDFVYVLQYVMHCLAILAWTAMIGAGAAFAYMR